MENQIFTLFEEISKICNYRQLLRNNDFLINLEELDDQSRNQLRKKIHDYFKCPVCNNRQLRLEDGGRVCYDCDSANMGHESYLSQFRDCYECLKCFKMLHKDYFNCCRQKHLCAFCVSKEIAKGRQNCRICNQEYEYKEHPLQCRHCSEYAAAQDVFLLRCHCQYCRDCFKLAKAHNRCLNCQGVNMTASEMYDFSTREQEMCILCETNYPIFRVNNRQIEEGEFFKRKCCFLDICKACTKKHYHGDSKCPGCKRKSEIV